MNRVCSAGTGSFLEEQALAHGLDDIALFGKIAARGERPPDLGRDLHRVRRRRRRRGARPRFTREDIFAGLQYSVIRNHKHRVMGQRRFLERVFFEGSRPANPSLARTLAAVTGREVWVPPDPGAMGAIGIAQLATAAAGDGLESGRRSTWLACPGERRRAPRVPLPRPPLPEPLPRRVGDRRRRRHADEDRERRELSEVRRRRRTSRAQAAQGRAERVPASATSCWRVCSDEAAAAGPPAAGSR